jgi:hypothetical protein
MDRAGTTGTSSKTMLHRLIYVSRNMLTGSAREMEQAVLRILDSSRRNNQRDGLTGALLFNDNCFAQVLEGDSTMLHTVFERIQCDPRHCDTVVLEFGPAEREFGQWSMAYAGRIEGEEARFAMLTAPDAAVMASERILDLLRGVVTRMGAA